jgi:hypothetical protein
MQQDGDHGVLAEPDRALRLRPYEPGDEHAIVSLFQRTFNTPFDLDAWRWKYQRGPWARPELSTVVQMENGEIIGHLGAMLHAISLVGQPQLVAQTVDFIIDAHHRGQHVFRELFKVFAAHAESSGIPVLMGFPSQHVLGPMHQLGRHVAILEKYHLPLGSEFHTRLRQRVLAVPEAARFGFELNHDYELDSRFDVIWQSCARLENLSVWKDREYMSWKYVQRPASHRFLTLELRGQAVAVCVCRERDRRVAILDLLALDKSIHAAQELLLRIADHYQGRGFEELAFAGSDPWFFREVFSDFEHRPAFWGSFFVKATDPKKAYLYENPLNWTLTRGDSDS